MKLKQLQQRDGYIFSLTFSNDVMIETDLAPLIADHIASTELASARIDPEWGCLEFNNGAVDIEPNTLYHWAESHNLCHH